jgi:hypothetical protein
MITLLALTLAPLARVLGLLRPDSCAMHILYVIHKLVVVLSRPPRAVLPLTLRLRIFPDRVFVM